MEKEFSRRFHKFSMDAKKNLLNSIHLLLKSQWWNEDDKNYYGLVTVHHELNNWSIQFSGPSSNYHYSFDPKLNQILIHCSSDPKFEPRLILVTVHSFKPKSKFIYSYISFSRISRVFRVSQSKSIVGVVIEWKKVLMNFELIFNCIWTL